MKRLLIIIALMLTVFTTQAQNSDEVVNSSSDLSFAPALSQSPNLKAQRLDDDGEMLQSRFFLEGIIGYESYGSPGIGASFAYVPKRVGAYISWTGNNTKDMVTAGVVFRPFLKSGHIDWQLYGGYAFYNEIYGHYNSGIEIGTRFSPCNGTGFAWWSISASRVFYDNTSFTLIGLSVSIVSLCSWFVIY